LDVNVTWFDIAIPEFSIDFDPVFTKITSDSNSLFYL